MEARVLQELTLARTRPACSRSAPAAAISPRCSRARRPSVTQRRDRQRRLRRPRQRGSLARGFGNVRVETGDGARGCGADAYDAIVLTGSTPMLPERFFEQLEARRPPVRGRRRRAGDDRASRAARRTRLARSRPTCSRPSSRPWSTPRNRRASSSEPAPSIEQDLSVAVPRRRYPRSPTVMRSRSAWRFAHGARARRGPAADLPRGAAERPDARRGARDLGGHAGARAAGALRPAAQRERCRRSANVEQLRRERSDSDPPRRHRQPELPARPAYGVGVAAAVPRRRTWSRYDQAKQQVAQADYTLVVAQQDLILRVADRLFRRAARASSTSSSPRARRPRCPSSSRRRSATSRSASRRSPTPTKRRPSTTRSSRRRSARATTSTTGARRCARSSAACRSDLKRVGRGLRAARCRTRTRSTTGSTARSPTTCRCGSRSTTTTSRRSKSTRQRAGHLPTRRSRRELPARRRAAARPASPAASTTRGRRQIGVQLNVPIYQGGFVDSRSARRSRCRTTRGRTSRSRAAPRCSTRRRASPASTARRRR